jgi:hypothetical protein
MNWVLTVIGVFLVVIGIVWILQGINILPGSFMTGHIQWAIYGAIAAVVGLVLIVRTSRRRPR